MKRFSVDCKKNLQFCWLSELHHRRRQGDVDSRPYPGGNRKWLGFPARPLRRINDLEAERATARRTIEERDSENPQVEGENRYGYTFEHVNQGQGAQTLILGDVVRKEQGTHDPGLGLVRQRSQTPATASFMRANSSVRERYL